MRLALAAGLLLATTAVKAEASSSSSSSKAEDPAARVAALLADALAGEVDTAAELGAASKNISAWTAWKGGEAVKVLPPPVPRYALQGPCSHTKIKGKTSAPKILPPVNGTKFEDGDGDEAVDKGAAVSILPTLTLPTNCSAASDREAPWPVVVFYSGFSSPSLIYQSYAQHLASWGYAVVQYDLATAVNLTPDAVELPFLPPVLAWAEKAAASEGAALDGANRLAVAGHSRGGKLAALQFCGAADPPLTGLPGPIRAAGLVDPVDNTLFSPASALYPPGAPCLEAADRPVALVGAGIAGACNPPGANYPTWAAAAPDGSVTARLLKAAHGTFVDSVDALDVTVDAVCGPGGDSHTVAATTAAAQLVAWFDQQLGTADPAAGALSVEWAAWAAAQGDWMEWSVSARRLA